MVRVRFNFKGKCGKIRVGGQKGNKEMKRSRAQIKAELLKRFEQEVDEILDWQERNQAPNLSQFEEEILVTQKEISIALLEEMLQGEEQREPVDAPRCEQCGRVMEGKGKQPQVIETRVGTLRLEREYYYCSHCKAGVFPPGSAVSDP